MVSNHVFPNGICTAHDGQSVLIASTGLFRVDRLCSVDRAAIQRLGNGDTRQSSASGLPDRTILYTAGPMTRSVGDADVAVIDLICVGQLPPSFIEYALRHGADGIFINACPGGDCSFRLGKRWLHERLAGAREPHLQIGRAHV